MISIAFFVLGSMKPETKESVGIKICDDIETYDLKLVCLAIFTGNPWKCKDAGNFDTYCYDAVFSSMKNTSEPLCKSFTDYYPRTTCYFNLAKIEKNPSLCEDSGGNYQRCSWDLAKILKDFKLCEKIEKVSERDECLAEVTGDQSFCKNITDDSERSICFITLGKNLDIKKCGEMASTENPSYAYAQQCIASVALATKDISLCYQIESKEAKWTCVAQLSKSIDVCEKGDSQFWVDFCKIEFIKNSLS